MKVLAGVPKSYNTATHDYIVEVTQEEMSILLGGKQLGGYYGNLSPGAVHNLAAEWTRLHAVWDARKGLEGAAETIHAIAKTLESFSPQVDELLRVASAVKIECPGPDAA